MFVRGQSGKPLTSGTIISSAKISFQHGNCKKEAELVGERKVDVGERGERPRGSSLWKICGGSGQGNKIKRDRLRGGGLHDKQVCICPSKYIKLTPLKENKQNVSILNKRPCTDK